MRPQAFPLDPIRTRGTQLRPLSLALSAVLFVLASLATAKSNAQDAPAPTEMPVESKSLPAVESTALPVAAEPMVAPPTAAAAPLPAEDEGGIDPAEVADADDTPVVQIADPATTSEPEPEPGDDPRTQAERDFQAIYAPQEVPLGAAAQEGSSGQEYDPIADATLPAPAEIGVAYDPWQRYNRQMHRFNNAVDRTIARPLARAYVRVMPRPVRLGVSNFFSNLGQPVSAVNSLLQGEPKRAAQAIGRFALNSTLGIGGIFDPASDAKLPNKSEDFGQTLGVWGWQRSRYVELPLFGPRTVRDVVGMVGDAPLSPLRQVEADQLRIPLQGLQLVDVRTQLLSTDSLREGAEDDYALVRDAWSQRRNYQIFGDRLEPGETGLPDYLLEENNPIVPAGAMPVMPTDPN